MIVAPDIPASSWVDPVSVEVVSEFIDRVLDLKETWPIDPERIVVTGYSAGGIGTWNLTDEFPRLFSAGLPVAADPVTIDSRDESSTPMYVVHGEEDELFPLEVVRSAVDRVVEQGAPVHVVVVEDVGHTALSAYVEPLSGAVEWLEGEVWDD